MAKRGTIVVVIWFLGILVMVLVAVVAIVFVSSGTGGMRPIHDDRPDSLVPADRRLRAQDLREVRFTVGLRGYRMDEVDALLARLAEELEESSLDREHDDGPRTEQTE